MTTILSASGRMDGKVAIVTGAGSVGEGWGNGRAIAVRLAQEGARVLAVDRVAERLDETLDRAGAARNAIKPWITDVTKTDSVAAMAAACIEAFGRIDVLVNNVGFAAPGGPVELDEDLWDLQIDLNLKSVYLTCKHVLPKMIAQRSGSIVNISSTSALRWSGNAQVAYAASKAGVIQLSRVVAVQNAPHGVRVNTVIPGMLHTPLVDAVLAPQRTGGNIEALLAQRQKRIPIGFMGDGRDTANAVLFLASDEARFITGTELVVDGGMVARCD